MQLAMAVEVVGVEVAVESKVTTCPLPEVGAMVDAAVAEGTKGCIGNESLECLGEDVASGPCP